MIKYLKSRSSLYGPAISNAPGFPVTRRPAGRRISVTAWPRIWIFAVQAFFVSMLVLPTTFQLVRGTVLLVLVGIGILIAMRHWSAHRDIVILWFSTTLVGVLGILWGLVSDTPGALRVSTVYVIWPALFVLFVGLTHNLTVIRRLESALLLGVSVATAMALVVLVGGLLRLDYLVYNILAFQDAGFGAYDGFIELRIHSLATVMYGFPFVVALLLVRRREMNRLKKVFLWLLIILMFVVSIGSGRRMFWLLVLLTPFLALFCVQISALRLTAIHLFFTLIFVSVAAAGVFLAIVTVFPLELSAIAQNFGAAFLGQEASSGLRYEQALALWGAFENSPLIGQGLGATVHVIRSDEQPWAYELWYIALLMNVGLVGFCVYAIGVGWVVVRGSTLAQRDPEFARLFVPQMAALSGFIIMTGTNPYLGKFDYLWIIFLPVALINAYLTHRN